MRISRRELLGHSLLLAGGACLCSFEARADLEQATCCRTPVLEETSYTREGNQIRIDLAKAPSLKPVGGAAVVMLGAGEERIIVVRSGRREFSAVSGLCTHARQILSYIPERRLLMCNGFNHSLFTLDGKVYKGPAEGELKTYRSILAGSELRIEWNGTTGGAV